VGPARGSRAASVPADPVWSTPRNVEFQILCRRRAIRKKEWIRLSIHEDNVRFSRVEGEVFTRLLEER
jgi:hypothetical protein